MIYKCIDQNRDKNSSFDQLSFFVWSLSFSVCYAKIKVLLPNECIDTLLKNEMQKCNSLFLFNFPSYSLERHEKKNLETKWTSSLLDN